MFARRVFMQLKPDSVATLTEKMETQVLPALRRQPGFRDEVTLIGNGGTESLEITLWDARENIEAYNRDGYPEVAKLLAEIVDGTPKVRIYEVANSTFHKLAAEVLA